MEPLAATDETQAASPAPRLGALAVARRLPRGGLLTLRLFAPWPRGAARIDDHPGLVAWSLAFALASIALADYAIEVGHGHDALAFNPWGLYAAATWLFAATALLFLLAMAGRRLDRLGPLLTGLFLVECLRAAALPVAALAAEWAPRAVNVGCVLAVVRMLWGELDVAPARRAFLCVAGGAALTAALVALPESRLFRPAPGPSPPRLNIEDVYLDQKRLVDDALQAVLPSRADVVDTYFVGFAPFAGQDVFHNEVGRIAALFRERLGAAGRTALLVNSRDTVADLPLANGHNLAAVLAGVGAKMGGEDVLFLHMTSHGSKDHEFSVEFENLGLNDLDAEDIRAIVDGADLPWRVIVVSACFSGGYLDALRSPRSLIITASRADRASFGCEHGRDFTYFGEALYENNLADADYQAAFERAKAVVAEREREEGLEPSLPQLWIGEAMAAKLEEAR